MRGTGSHELDAQTRTSRGRTPGLRARLAHDYAATYGRDPRQDCLDGLERVARMFGKLPAREEREFVRSIPQMCRGLGLPYDGTVRDARRRWRDSVMRTLGYLQEMGWVDGVEALYEANGEGRGILVRLPAGVAQSVRASLYSLGAGKAARRPDAGAEPPFPAVSSGCSDSFFSGEVRPPLREKVPAPPRDVDVKQDQPKKNANGGASARVVPKETPGQRRAAHAARTVRSVRAAVAVSLAVAANGGLEGVGPALEEHPAVREAPVTAVARVLFREALRGVPTAISAKRQAQLEAAARRIDRYDGRPGAWIGVACRVLAAWQAGEAYEWVSEPPRSLGALAVELKRIGNTYRFGALRRRTERLRPLMETAGRQPLKARCTCEARQLQRERVESSPERVPWVTRRDRRDD